MSYNADILEKDGSDCQVGVRDHKCGSCVGGRSCHKCQAGGYKFDERYDGEHLRPSLDSNQSSSAVEREVSSGEVSGSEASGSVSVGGWGRQQKRGYQRCLSCMELWSSQGYQMLWVMLSTDVSGDRALLAEHHNRLRKMVERRGFPQIHHFQIRTSEGNGVLHIIWAWKAGAGFREKSFYVGQKWLSRSWLAIHGAPVVWISRIGTRRRDMFKVARYCISQYCGEQAGYEYMSYSWRRSFGFPVVSCWRKFKELALSFDELVHEWSRFLAGEIVWCGYGGFTMGSIRLGYQSYGRDFWTMLHWV